MHPAFCATQCRAAAMVMAIVSYETGIPLDQLIFHKIKAL